MPSFTSISRSTRRTAIKALLGAPIVIASLKKATSVSAENVAAADPRSLGAMNFVVAGLDYRNEWEPENTDVLMVARVDLLANTVRAFSIPRDLWVSIPGYGEDKITRAYDFGSANAGRDFKAGADAISATIEANFGIPIDAAVMTTFGGFERIVDAFGGVDVNNPYDLYDGQYPTDDYGIKEIFYPAGEIKLSGEQALEFCRTRHQDGDDGRTTSCSNTATPFEPTSAVPNNSRSRWPRPTSPTAASISPPSPITSGHRRRGTAHGSTPATGAASRATPRAS
jgi:LCP family protein required for cell wall assembly